MENVIKCPKCGEVFKVDDSLYVSIVKQIRDKEFAKDVTAQLKTAEKDKQSAVELAEEKLTKNFMQQLNEKNLELQKMQGAVELARSEVSKDFAKQLSAKDIEIQNLKSQLQIAESQMQTVRKEQEAAVTEAVSDRDKEILMLQHQIESMGQSAKLAVEQVTAEKDKKITVLEAEVAEVKNAQELLVAKVLAESKEEIVKLQGELRTNKEIAKSNEQNLKNSYETQLKDRDEEIQRIKDMKLQMSTKMVGETLEQHCEIEFNNLRATGFQGAYFEKDNDDSKGSKGDYIFRDFDETGNEYISIMFEMKNEVEETEKKHKNEDFFKKLDKDRNEKNCEYAVLVSMLEKDSEYYNSGIVDVSHRYPKMYVIRPQFFIPLITLLRNASRKSLDYRRELVAMKQQNIDVTNFEKQMEDFREAFGKNYRLAGEHFTEAIKQIDKSIDDLQKTKAALLGSNTQLEWANNKVQALSIKKLTKNSPMLRQKFEEVKSSGGDRDED